MGSQPAKWLTIPPSLEGWIAEDQLGLGAMAGLHLGKPSTVRLPEPTSIRQIFGTDKGPGKAILSISWLALNREHGPQDTIFADYYTHAENHRYADI